MKVHLCGLPINVHRRLKELSNNWADAVPDPHVFRATPTFSYSQRPFTSSEILEIRNAVGEGFTHILIPGSRDWRSISSQFEFDCRIHLLRFSEALHDLTWNQLRAALHTVVELEAAWLARVSPHDLRHPLLLPPPIFSTHRDVTNYWRICDTYSLGGVPKAEAILTSVERLHRRPDSKGIRCWLDNKKRRFRFDPGMHARTKGERQGVTMYRFCFAVPPGFHYDVTHDYGNDFEMEIGGKIEYCNHVNVTPWGHVRRG